MSGKPTDAELLAYAERYIGEIGLSPVEQEMFAQLRDGVLRRLNGHPETDDVAVEDAVTEARMTSVEATLRHMDDRLTRIVEQIHALDSRQQRSEDRLARMETDQAQIKADQAGLREQVRELAGPAAPAGYSRVWLAGGAAAMTVVIVLLLILTWRLL